VNGALLVAGYALRESLRRRVFTVVIVLTAVFLGLYGLGAIVAFNEVEELTAGTELEDERVIVGSTIFGLAMFGTLFLGAVLAVFLTHSAVRGDTERGILQPLVVRPLGRTELLAGRFAAAAAVCAAYVLTAFVVALLLTRVAGDWWPDRVVTPALALVVAVMIIAALSLLGSVFFTATANGIAIFMVFGAGLTAGLLGQIGEGINAHTLEDVARVATWVLPFEGLYQAGLSALTADASGAASFAVQLGPFGGAQEASAAMWLWAAVYLALVGLAARAAFARRDL